MAENEKRAIRAVRVGTNDESIRDFLAKGHERANVDTNAAIKMLADDAVNVRDGLRPEENLEWAAQHYLRTVSLRRKLDSIEKGIETLRKMYGI